MMSLERVSLAGGSGAQSVSRVYGLPAGDSLDLGA
jgi:hypothetical protein